MHLININSLREGMQAGQDLYDEHNRLKLGWSKDRLMAFGIGCLLHDIGKIFIESEILNKPGRLSDAEFETMKAHPTVGYELVRTIAPNANALVSHVAYQFRSHHPFVQMRNKKMQSDPNGFA